MRKSLYCTALLLSSLYLLSGEELFAQFGGNNGGGFQNFGGIIIDGEGVLGTTRSKKVSKTALKKLQEEFSKQQLDASVIEESEARTLSLKQLDAAVKEVLDSGEKIPASLRYLAGLQRIDYIVLDRNNEDVYIVGPAEGFAPGPTGQLVGVSSGRPPMQLDDLVVAIRSTLGGQSEMGVSIDPTDENMANLQNYIRRNSNAVTTSVAQRRYQTMGKVLGNQVISIWGVPEDSHFALALAEADLRMKRIALGTEPSGVRGVQSHLSLLIPQGNSLQRWWFVPDYETLGTNESRTVFEIKGKRAQLMAQEEIAGPNGQRNDAAFTRKTTEKFALLFTEKFDELANANTAFAKLQGLYDLSLVAAIVRSERPFGNDSPNISTLLNDERLPLESYPVPKFVKSSSTYRKSSRGMLLGLIGGVTIRMNHVINNTEVQPRLYEDRFQPGEKTDNWWWNSGATTTSPVETLR